MARPSEPKLNSTQRMNWQGNWREMEEGTRMTPHPQGKGGGLEPDHDGYKDAETSEKCSERGCNLRWATVRSHQLMAW